MTSQDLVGTLIGLVGVSIEGIEPFKDLLDQRLRAIQRPGNSKINDYIQSCCDEISEFCGVRGMIKYLSLESQEYYDDIGLGTFKEKFSLCTIIRRYDDIRPKDYIRVGKSIFLKLKKSERKFDIYVFEERKLSEK